MSIMRHYEGSRPGCCGLCMHCTCALVFAASLNAAVCHGAVIHACMGASNPNVLAPMQGMQGWSALMETPHCIFWHFDCAPIGSCVPCPMQCVLQVVISIALPLLPHPLTIITHTSRHSHQRRVQQVRQLCLLAHSRCMHQQAIARGGMNFRQVLCHGTLAMHACTCFRVCFWLSASKAAVVQVEAGCHIHQMCGRPSHPNTPTLQGPQV